MMGFPKTVSVALAFMLLARLAACDYTWRITAANMSGAAAQSGRFTGNENDDTIATWFMQWAQWYDKTYNTVQELHSAKNNFRQTLRSVHRHNIEPAATYAVDVNQFADLGFPQFANMYLMRFDPTKQGARQLLERQQVNVATRQNILRRGARKLQSIFSVDWRISGKVTPIKNQGQCGSCWAFAATAAIESAYLLHQQTNYTTTPINLSEQQLVSCATRAAGYYSDGCSGGCSDMAINYVYKVNQTTDRRYPYTATTGVCNSSIVNGTVVLPNADLRLGGAVKYVTANNQTLLMSAINMQPTIVYFQVTNDFYGYKMGVYVPNSGCTQSANHVMVAVGYYYNGNNTESYWILKNSWGTSWGEQGYVRVQMTGDGVGPCLLQTYPIYPVISFKYMLNLP